MESMKTNNLNEQTNTAVLIISGRRYEINVDDVRKVPSSRLFLQIISKGNRNLYFSRPLESFEAVLAFYLTGELHMPLSVCPGAFKTELKFWGIEPQVMSKCCYYRYLSHQDDQETLDGFHCHLFPDLTLEKQSKTCFRNIRAKLWNIVDNGDTSVPSRVYFSMNICFVLLSIMILALSTIPYFRRHLTKCEYEVVLGREVMVNGSVAKGNLTCDRPLSDAEIDAMFPDIERAGNQEQIQSTQSATSLSTPVTGPFKTPPTPPSLTNDDSNITSRAERRNTTRLKTHSTFFFEDDTNVNVDTGTFFEHLAEELKPNIGLAKKTVRVYALDTIDFGLLVFFTVDLIVRLACCPSLRRFFLKTVNVIDTLVVVAAFGHLAIDLIDERQRYETTFLDLLEVFQVMRSVRLVRLAQHIIGFKVLTFCLKVCYKDLMVLFLYIFIAVVIFANFIFFVESDADIESIPVGWWWAINTLTTVGFGDVVPVTLYGRLIGAVCAVFGVLIMSIAIPVFVKTFMLLYQYAVLYKKAMSKPLETHIYIYRQTNTKQCQDNDTDTTSDTNVE